MSYIEMVASTKRFQAGGTVIVANDRVSFQIEEGELTIILGASGAGKSTVLNILGGMDTNDEGQVIVDGRDISDFSPKHLTAYRRYDVGFVFQFYNLVANLTAKENVELASEIVREALDPELVLQQVGLENRIDNFPAQLSGGEQQRVAIARAVAKKPKLLLCDEPTGALDYRTGKQVLQLLQDMSREGTTVVVVTHNAAVAPIAALMLLGVFALVGLKVTGPNMRDTAATYYEQANLADLTVISTWGLDETDREVIDAAAGAQDVEYGYVTDVTLDDTTTSLRALSVPERLSLFVVESGSLPADGSEIALDAGLADTYRIGDKITLTEAPSAIAGVDDEDAGQLAHDTFTVSGFVTSTEFVDRKHLGPTTVGTGQLDGIAALAPDAFDSEVYTIARLDFDSEGLGPYDPSYRALLGAWRSDLEELLADQPARRLETLRAEK